MTLNTLSRTRLVTLLLILHAGLSACQGGRSIADARQAEQSDPPASEDTNSGDTTLASRFPGVRTIPDPLCAEEYAGITGLYQRPPTDIDLGDYDVFSGEEASPEIASTLPEIVHLKGRLESYTDAYYFAVREGRIYTKVNLELSQENSPWRAMKLPRCLDGQVSEISADGDVLIALNQQRDIYTINYSRHDYGVDPWTRRWGPFFWTELGGFIYPDVRDWASSEFASVDKYYVDSAGREQKLAGILTVYLLRGNQRHITYLDPWLPMDDSREVCGPERGTVSIAGLAGSGSTVMVVTHDGDIYTRLHEFDISGANTFLLDYSWHDQDDLENPVLQLPGPGWIQHPRVPGQITDRLSLRKLPPGTAHRLMRIEGQDAAGNTGYWEKDQAELDSQAWKFVATGEALLGETLPRAGQRFSPEDFRYFGLIDGFPTTVENFNPHCSPSTLRIDFPDGALDLILHSVDGLRQERRTRGLDLYPRYYRGAVEIPSSVYRNKDQLSPLKQDFLARHFGQDRFLDGPLLATAGNLQILEACWSFSRDIDDLASLITQPPVPDAGILVAEIYAEQEQGRTPPLCLGLQP
ncbi:MAG: hypothetical protein ACSHXK_06650 [Oceanococcus sp.]